MQLDFNPNDTKFSGEPWRDYKAEAHMFDFAIGCSDEVSVLLSEDLSPKQLDKAIHNLVHIGRNRGLAVTIEPVGLFPARIRATLRRTHKAKP